MKNTKKALFTSALCLLLCMSMLIGTTFAWFTDEVNSGVNKIYAGNLDVDVVDQDGNSIQDKSVLFDGILWEPGAVAYENITVKNLGTLALKYAMYINFENQNYVIDANGKLTPYGLASALKVAIVDEAITETDRDKLVASVAAEEWTTLANLVEQGALYPVDQDDTTADSKTYGIVIWWQPGENDNNWNVHNGKTTTDKQPLHIDLGIKLTATQLMAEEDSFGDDYDEDAKFDILPQASVTDIFPQAWSTYLIKDIINEGIGSGVPTTLTLDTAYSFKGEPTGTAEQNEYADWFVDFYVSLDKDPVDGLVLSGQYGSWDKDNWYAFYIPTNGFVEAGKFYPLLGTVTGGGVSNWTYTNICSGVGTFNCGAVDMLGLNAGTTMTVQLRLINPEKTDETIVVKEIKYTFANKPYPVNNTAELAAAIEAGYYDLWLNDGTYNMPAAAKGKTLTISGTNAAIIEVVPGGQGEAGGQLDYSLDGSTVTFNGVTIKTNSQLYAGYARLSATYNNCVIQNTYNLGVGTSEFNNCTFNITNEYLRVGGASVATFNGCTFNTDGRAILVFQDGTNVAQTVTVKDCTFNATAAASTWNGIHVAAVSYDGSQGGTYTVNFEGNNVVDSDFNGLWQIKNGADKVTVTGLN